MEWFVARVRSLMDFEIIFLGKTLGTITAGIWFFAGVCPNVLGELSGALEAFVARGHITGVRQLGYWFRPSFFVVFRWLSLITRATFTALYTVILTLLIIAGVELIALRQRLHLIWYKFGICGCIMTPGFM